MGLCLPCGSCCLPGLCSDRNTWKQKYLQQQLIHLALNSYCLFFFFCPLPKCSLFLSQGNYGSPLFLLNITLHAVEPSVHVAFQTPLCLLELQHPTAGRAVLVPHPWCLLSFPSLVGMGCFFCCLPNMSSAHKSLKQHRCSTTCVMSAALPAASTSCMWQAKGLSLADG